jgi:hypothetical protein
MLDVTIKTSLRSAKNLSMKPTHIRTGTIEKLTSRMTYGTFLNDYTDKRLMTLSTISNFGMDLIQMAWCPQ